MYALQSQLFRLETCTYDRSYWMVIMNRLLRRADIPLTMCDFNALGADVLESYSQAPYHFLSSWRSCLASQAPILPVCEEYIIDRVRWLGCPPHGMHLVPEGRFFCLLVGQELVVWDLGVDRTRKGRSRLCDVSVVPKRRFVQILAHFISRHHNYILLLLYYVPRYSCYSMIFYALLI